MKRILLIQGQPGGDGQYLCHALQEGCVDGAKRAGHTLRIIDIASLDFSLLRSRRDWYGEMPESLSDSRAVLEWADHVVMIYPLWLGTMPALLKAYIEQLFRPGAQRFGW